MRPAFPDDASPVDIAAILKRTLTIVNTNWWIYVRPPVPKRHHVVHRYPIDSDYYITEEARDILSKWTKTGYLLPQDEREQFEKEEQEFFPEGSW